MYVGRNMKVAKGRMNSLTTIFKYYLDENILIQLKNEKISIFSDGEVKRTKKRVRATAR